MVDVFSTHEYTWRTEHVKIISKRREGKGKKMGADEPKRGTLYAYMEMSQQNPPCTTTIINKNII
jgi:hypothetical protein